MIEELVFTSAPRGLQLGKSGFCTVASTPGMAANLARLLESLSGYRHLNSPGTPEALENPVVYSHLKARVGGRNFSIVSRVSDAGLDYSNRSNKLAHHFAIKETRALSNGPSQLLLDESHFFTSWQQEPTKLTPRSISSATNIPMPCTTWQALTGDAGWAGDVIEAVQKRRQVYLIINESTPALSLINELMSLLSIQNQWDVTFTTFFTKLPPSVDCAIRCVMAGSPEVAIARRSQANLVLDLTAPLGQSSSRHAVAARTGKLIKGPGKATTSSTFAPQIDQILEENAGDPAVSDLPTAAVKPKWSVREVDEDYGLEEMPPELASRNQQEQWQQGPPTLQEQKRGSGRIKWALASCIVVFLIAALIVVSFLPDVRKSVADLFAPQPQAPTESELPEDVPKSADKQKSSQTTAKVDDNGIGNTASLGNSKTDNSSGDQNRDSSGSNSKPGSINSSNLGEGGENRDSSNSIDPPLSIGPNSKSGVGIGKPQMQPAKAVVTPPESNTKLDLDDLVAKQLDGPVGKKKATIFEVVDASDKQFEFYLDIRG